jgi:hypothetical protein
MAKAIITLSDIDEGHLRVATEFVPPLKREDDPTLAQAAALACLKAIEDALKKEG